MLLASIRATVRSLRRSPGPLFLHPYLLALGMAPRRPCHRRDAVLIRSLPDRRSTSGHVLPELLLEEYNQLEGNKGAWRSEQSH
jgi:hypothetical protein